MLRRVRDDTHMAPGTSSPTVARDDNGTLRVGGTRVTFESVLWAHQRGATPEKIHQQFPSLSLADIYEAIAHYLRHQTELDRYLAGQEKASREVAERIRKQFPPEGSHARLEARLKR